MTNNTLGTFVLNYLAILGEWDGEIPEQDCEPYLRKKLMRIEWGLIHDKSQDYWVRGC